MEYLEVFIEHDISELANLFIMELDENRNQIRVVEKHYNGIVGFADKNCEVNGAFLATEIYPTIEELNNTDECIAKKISKQKFEKIWENAKIQIYNSK